MTERPELRSRLTIDEIRYVIVPKQKELRAERIDLTPLRMYGESEVRWLIYTTDDPMPIASLNQKAFDNLYTMVESE